MSLRSSARSINKTKNDTQHIFRRLSVLEVEKKVVCQSRRDVLRRLEKIDARLKELEDTTADLLGQLDLYSSSEDGAGANHTKASSPVASKNKGLKIKSQSEADGNRGFILRY